MSPPDSIRRTVPDEQAGKRLDKVLAELFPDYSRGRLQGWLRQGLITVDGAAAAVRQKTRGGEVLEVNPPVEAEPGGVAAEPIELDVVYEDADLLIINKPPGMVVHPAAGNPGGTLQNALLHRWPELALVPRAGLVHRLDKDTSGLLAVARSLRAHKSLTGQLRRRTMGREYIAVVQGVVVAGGTVEAAIGRHPRDRKRMAVRQGGREAVTHYRVRRRYRHHTELAVHLESGRTHQIRVHMAHIRKPLLGDPVYGGRPGPPRHGSEALKAELQQFRRQALHAARLQLQHPAGGETLEWSAPVPEDLQRLLDALENDAQSA
jgi:23S rRNA pseudouridine1911/1915/1917 synthase